METGLNQSESFFYCPKRTGQSHKKCWENWKSKKVVAFRFKDSLILESFAWKTIFTQCFILLGLLLLFFLQMLIFCFLPLHIFMYSHANFITFSFPKILLTSLEKCKDYFREWTSDVELSSCFIFILFKANCTKIKLKLNLFHVWFCWIILVT